mgnify:CR=1 FL=1
MSAIRIMGEDSDVGDLWWSDCLRLGQLLPRPKIIKGTLLRSANHLSFLLVGACLERGNLDFCGSRIYESPKGAVKTSSMSDLLSPLRGQIGSLRDRIIKSPKGRWGFFETRYIIDLAVG